MIAVRELQAGDLAGFRAMNAVFAAGFEEPETYTANSPDDAYALDWLNSHTTFAVLAECEDDAVGAIAGFVLPKFEQNRSELYIYDVAVIEAYRRRGVASAMIAETRRIARDKGARTVFVQADTIPEDERARALYRKFASSEIMAHHFDIVP